MDAITREEIIAGKLKARNLPGVPDRVELLDWDELEIRSVEQIAKRAAAAAISAHLAWYGIFEDGREERLDEHQKALWRFKADECLFGIERRVFEDEFNESVTGEVEWECQAAYALLWALGLVDDIDDPADPKDPQDFVDDVYIMIDKYRNLEDLLKNCRLRSAEELEDEFQLYYHYHWHCVDTRLFNYYGLSDEERQKLLQTVSADVVTERRKALQWAVYSEEDDNGDWDFPLDT